MKKKKVLIFIGIFIVLIMLVTAIVFWKKSDSQRKDQDPKKNSGVELDASDDVTNAETQKGDTVKEEKKESATEETKAEESTTSPKPSAPNPTTPTTPEEPSVPVTKPKYDGDTGNERLNSLCDGVLDTIITAGMNEHKKLKAVYDWVEVNIRYSGSTAIGDWRAGAITSLTTRKGNCAAYCYTSRALLTRLGFENVEIHTDNQDHYWNMVKYNGNWYHWDTTAGWGTERFLWTTNQIKSYTYTKSNGRTIRYSPFNESKYPATPQ